MAIEELTYRLDLYEGPLDLLLSLIAKNKMDIRDIPISEICEQYMTYINEAQRMNLDIAGEFIVMASELMLIKSRMLLPADPENPEDPRANLIDALLLYQKAKEAADDLRPLYAEYAGRMAKEEDEIPPEKGFPLGLDPTLLSRSLHVMLNRLQTEEKVPASLINPLIKTRVVSVELCISHLLTVFENHDEVSMFYLLKDAEDKPELVATFMGLLELIKLRRVLFCVPQEPDDATADIGSAARFNRSAYASEPCGLTESGLTVRFRLNTEYSEAETQESEFDHDDGKNIEQPSTDKND